KPAGASPSGRCRVPGLWLGVGFDGGRPVEVLVEEPDGFLFVVLQGMGVAPGREAGVMMAHHLGNSPQVRTRRQRPAYEGMPQVVEPGPLGQLGLLPHLAPMPLVERTPVNRRPE